MTFERTGRDSGKHEQKEQRFLFYLFRALLQLGMDCILALLDFQRHILRTNLSSTVQSGFRQTISKITQPVRRRMHPHENDFAPHHWIETDKAKGNYRIYFGPSTQVEQHTSLDWISKPRNTGFHRYGENRQASGRLDLLCWRNTGQKRILPLPAQTIVRHPPASTRFWIDRFVTRELEQTIKAHPQYWLWSHNRWKRTKEEWLRRQQEETKWLWKNMIIW